jgi:predicted metal-dependent phosphoesterase TrpH
MTPTSSVGHADLHMHTNASDGAPTAAELLNFVAKHRPHLDVIAITDHDTLDASLWAYEQQERYPFEIVPGVEVSSRDGHILALWVTQAIKANMDLADTVAAIHEAGGVAILAHPVHPYLSEQLLQGLRIIYNPQVLIQAQLDGIETHNSGICYTGCNWINRILAKNLGLAVTSGSDAHTLGAIGTGDTCFPGSSANDLRIALRQKKTVAKGTPWAIADYITYFKHEKQRRATTSSGTTSSLPLTKHSA